MIRLRHILVTLMVGAVSAVGVIATAGPAAALPAFGTGPVSLPSSGGSALTSVTVGRHDSEGFDRIVFTFAGNLPAVHAAYVAQVTHDGSGAPVPLLGKAFIQLSMQPVATGSPQGTITPPGFLALKQVKGAGDFEAVSSYGLGQAAQRGYRVFTLTGPSRVVVDLHA